MIACSWYKLLAVRFRPSYAAARFYLQQYDCVAARGMSRQRPIWLPGFNSLWFCIQIFLLGRCRCISTLYLAAVQVQLINVRSKRKGKGQGQALDITLV